MKRRGAPVIPSPSAMIFPARAPRAGEACMGCCRNVRVAVLAVALPYLGMAQQGFGLIALPPLLLLSLLSLVAAYIVATEATKRWFWHAKARR